MKMVWWGKNKSLQEVSTGRKTSEGPMSKRNRRFTMERKALIMISLDGNGKKCVGPLEGEGKDT